MYKYLFNCDNGKPYLIENDCCLVCENCTDIFYDWNGPYAFFCGLTEKDGKILGYTHNHCCEKFKVDEKDKKIIKLYI